MLATIISVIFAIIFFSQTTHQFSEETIKWIGLSLLLMGGIFSIIASIIEVYAWKPLQKAESSNTPRVIELQNNDFWLKAYKGVMFLFPVLSAVIGLDLLIFHMINPLWGLTIWLILFGCALDAIYLTSRRIEAFLSPFSAVTIFGKKAIESIADEQEISLCKWIDALSEVALKAIDKRSPTLCNHVIDQYQDIVRVFLSSSKSISHHNDDKEMKELGDGDKVNFILTYLFQRIEMINDQAVTHRLEPICTRCITVMGKAVIYAGKYDMTLAAFPLHFLGRFTHAAQQAELPEVGIKASLTLEEVAHSLLTEVDVTYQPIKDAILSVIRHQTEIAKQIFKDNKNVNIEFLLHPFVQLKELLNSPKLSAHLDTPFLLQTINQVIEEFTTLDTILKTMPPLPDLEAIQQRANELKSDLPSTS